MTPRNDRRLAELTVRDLSWLCSAVLDVYNHAAASFTTQGQTAFDVDRVWASLYMLAKAHAPLAALAVALMRRPEDRAAINAIKAGAAPFLSGAPLLAIDDAAEASDARLAALFVGLAGAAANMLAIVDDLAAWHERDLGKDVRRFLAELEASAPLLTTAFEAGWAQVEAGTISTTHLN